MGQITPLVKDDIPHLVDLYMKAFPDSNQVSVQALGGYFDEIFFHNPWYDEALPSLVYRDDHRRIVGFLGVMPRRMSMNGRPIQVAISHHFMVEPDSRSTLAGVQLLKEFFKGPQDLSLAQATDVSRKIWEGLGGSTSLLYSIHWMRPLRPSWYFMSLLKRHGLPAPFIFASRPFCAVSDAILIRMPQSPFRQIVPLVSGEDLDVETLHACLSECSSKQSLRPEYNGRSLKWLLEKAAQKKRYGTLQKVLVRDAEQIIGWYLYYLNPGGSSEVLQIGARDNSINDVLDHLFYHAWQRGVITLSGQLEPRFMPELLKKYCLFNSHLPWMLVHSNKPELLQAIHRGDAFLTRLEGEWWIGFQSRQ